MNGTAPILRIAIALGILSAIFFVVERVAARGRNRVQPILRRGWTTDVVYWFVTPLLTKPLVRLLVIVPVAALVLMKVVPAEAFQSGGYSGFGPLSRQPIWLQTVQIYLLVDFMGYWSHRLFHQGAWWPFHAVHHSSEDLDWLGSLRVHPVNDMVNKLVQVTPVLLLGYNPRRHALRRTGPDLLCDLHPRQRELGFRAAALRRRDAGLPPLASLTGP